MKLKLFLSTLLFLPSFCFAQQTLKFENANEDFLEQITLFPQEKIHVHTDRSVYISGEQLWFRAYLVDAVLHRAMQNSRYVYVELINPQKNVVTRVKIRPNDGTFSGRLFLAETLMSGNYTLRAYTKYMADATPDYIFKKNIKIVSPTEFLIKIKSNFTYNESDKKILADFVFKDKGTAIKLKQNDIHITSATKDEFYVKIINDTIGQIKIPTSKGLDMLFVNIKNSDDYNLDRVIYIPDFGGDYDVSFFPEGGNLLFGANCCVAFKALKFDGTAETVDVAIVDETGEKIYNTQSEHLGMGKFYITPKSGKKYFAVCKNMDGIERRFELPQAKQGAYSLKTSQIKNNIYITLQKSDDISANADLYLLIHTRGISQYVGKWNGEPLVVNKNDFLSGVLQILLFDNNLNPLAERLIFNINDNDLTRTTFSTNQTSYSRRERVVATIDASNARNEALNGTCSVAVVDANDVSPDSTNSIMATLLLTSELKGYIENPNFYFEGTDKKASAYLDNLMMTQGWRRYNVPNLIRKNYEKTTNTFEKSQQISGVVKTYSGKNVVPESSIIVFSKNPWSLNSTVTNGAGEFCFNNIEIPDSIDFTVQALDRKNRRHVELFLNSEKYPDINANTLAYISQNVSKNKDESNYSDGDDFFAYNKGEKTINIAELIVLASRNKNRYKAEQKDKPWYVPLSARTILAQDIQDKGIVTIMDALSSVSALYFSNGRLVVYRPVRLGGFTDSSDPTEVDVLVLVNDMPIVSEGDEGSVQSLLEMIDINDVERIDVMKGVGQTMLYSSGEAAIVAIKTKNPMMGYEDKIRFNLKTISPLGFQHPASFYSPKYATQQQQNANNHDLRTTIYWNPNVKIENGKASFNFYTADTKSRYSVIIEGLSNDGKIIKYNGFIDQMK